MTEQSVIDVDRLRVIGARLLVRKCVQRDPDYIILPDQARETTNYCEIVKVGNKCKVFTNKEIGRMVQVPEYADGLHFLAEGSSEWAIVDEDLIEPVTYSDGETNED